MVNLKIYISEKMGFSSIDPKNSNFKNQKIRCRIIRFKSILCEFLRIFPKIKLDTGKTLEMTWNMYPFRMSSRVYGFPFRYSGEVKTKGFFKLDEHRGGCCQLDRGEEGNSSNRAELGAACLPLEDAKRQG